MSAPAATPHPFDTMPDDSKAPPVPETPAKPDAPAAPSTAQTLGSATYEIIRQRLRTQGNLLRERMAQLDARRTAVFGSIEFKLLQADRVVTAHNCMPHDMSASG